MRACTPAPLLELLRNKVLRAGPAGLTAGGVTSIDTLVIFGADRAAALHVNISAFLIDTKKTRRERGSPERLSAGGCLSIFSRSVEHKV